MKVLAFILDLFIDSADPVGTARFNVNYVTSDGQLSSSTVAIVTISNTEAVIKSDIKEQVATAVNQQLGTSINKTSVRIF